jgi:hypothetical protein
LCNYIIASSITIESSIEECNVGAGLSPTVLRQATAAHERTV